MDANVTVREEFTVVTPGGGPMYLGPRNTLFPITDSVYAGRVYVTSQQSQATAHCMDLNKVLRDNGIDDRDYLVAKRTVTTVVTEWDDSCC